MDYSVRIDPPPTAGAVAAPHAAASEAGAVALRAGGTAVDAAIAAAAALSVVYPHNCGVGGDLFALVAEPDGRVLSINASGPAAGFVDVEKLRALGNTMPTDGVHPVTVPGAVAGWERLHQIGGRLPWKQVLAEAQRLAGEGVPVSPGLAGAIQGASGVDTDPGLAEVFAPGGRRLGVGDRLVQPRLAATLRAIADDGASTLYRGAVAEALVRGLRAQGSALTAADFSDYAPTILEPLSAGFRGFEVMTSPPNSSGVLLLQALLALEASAASDPLRAGAGPLGAIFAVGNDQRQRMLCDPDFHPFDRDAWLGASRIAEIAGGHVASADTPAADAAGDTIAVVAVDEDGRAVSLIQSLFFGFGAEILEPTTGIVLHNRGSSFSLIPGHPNVIAPGKRPAHTLMPVMVRRGGSVIGVLGTMGGQVHAQIHAQLLLALLAGAPPADAVAAPRFAVWPASAGEVTPTARVEADVEPAAVASLAAAGFGVATIPSQSSAVGHAQVLWHDEDWQGGSDPRADGGVARVRR
ncbi:MAG: gamma-glutamyltransferase [Solirubrobacteraceae bacterium]